ncbi:D-lactate dehydrogenase [Enterococcus sp. AZ007]|uniref:D-2-hydroxyacid dehydrogenase n=1 Tax=Candidatus Enterococcus murrayae TaxID=2815321 RepID=A0ABS3HGW7_9ENTE|nr:D-2-hydroxyacid dehydrogenase [Enterococcus sp. MJM16]
MFVNEWVKKTGVQVDTVPYKLTLETVDMVRGYDGVSISEAGKFDSSIFPQLSKYGIKHLAQRTSGFEGFDLEAAKRSGIIITNVSSYSPESIAEFTLMLALQLVRRSKDLDQRVKRFDFNWSPEVRGKVMKEQTVAIIGVGRIGYEVAKLFKAFGSTINGYATHRNKNANDLFEYKDSIEEAIHNADIITLHIPGKEKNHHLFDKKMFNKFKPGACLINTSRGSLVNTSDLIEALDSGRVSAAALDVYENEAEYIPGKHEEISDTVFKELLNHPKVTFYPHCAYYTDVSMRNMVHYALDSIIEVIETGDSFSRVN